MKYKTCVSIAETSPKKLKQTLKIALKKSDYVEIRFDFLKTRTNTSSFRECKKRSKKNSLHIKTKIRGR